MMTGTETPLAAQLSTVRARAEMVLRAHMEAFGLRTKDGWRLVETTRDIAGGSELVLRPVHSSLLPGARLECVVQIEEATGKIAHVCRCESAGSGDR